MRELSELQKNFQDYILKQNPCIKEIITSTSNVSATTRLEIYRDAYYARLLESLSHDYDVLHKVMGDDEFNHLGRQYIDMHPSSFRSIRWFGKKLAIFMNNLQIYSETPWLMELADFEWLLSESFDAKDSPIVTLEEMANISFDLWPNLQFKIHPSLRKLNLHWNIVQLWNMVNEGNDYKPPQKMDKKQNWIIWRKNYDIQFCCLSSDERYMLDGMLLHKSFSEICEGLCEWIEEQNVALHAAMLLKRFIMDELITEIQIN